VRGSPLYRQEVVLKSALDQSKSSGGSHSFFRIFNSKKDQRYLYFG
jgi:hypothetical protein